MRGALAVAFLERIEKLLAGAGTQSSRGGLHEHFHLIGGTSTGAIIATALALGLTTADVKEFYFEMAPRVFRRSLFRLRLFQTVFDSRALKREIDHVIADRKLDSEDLLTGLAIVTKRMDTGSAWIVTNNPGARYWETPQDRSFIGNRHYRIADLVRASTAAPYYFAPHEIRIVDSELPGLFVDGGVSPHNNPALALFQVATIPAYGFGWPVGAERLSVVSVGTGTRRERLSGARARRMPAVGLAIEALKSIVADSSSQVLTMMQVLGHTDMPWTINSEIGDLKDVLLPREPLFTFQRYDVRLERDWLRSELGLKLDEHRVAALGAMENAANVPMLYDIGQAAAEKFVRTEHLIGAATKPADTA